MDFVQEMAWAVKQNNITDVYRGGLLCNYTFLLFPPAFKELTFPQNQLLRIIDRRLPAYQLSKLVYGIRATSIILLPFASITELWST